jgi:hypothetical protein
VIAVIRVPEETGAVAAQEEREAPSQSQTVEELFARLRAERSLQEGAPATGPGVAAAEYQSDLLGPAADGEEAIVRGGTATTVMTERAEELAVVAVKVPREEPVEAEELGDVEQGEQGEQGEEPGRDLQLSRRDDILGPVVAMLARRLKRALTDDQNEILARLRAEKGWSPEVLLPEAEHMQFYARASLGQLLDAARSGTVFAGGKPNEVVGIEDLAADLAAAIVVPLRRRLEGEGGETESGEDAALVEHVGAAFRDWKGARVERLAGDEAVAAFSRAALAATPSGVLLRWVVDDDGMECPDCDDNALAGPVPRGEAFPTGHPHPPAHTGCRCLLAPPDA